MLDKTYDSALWCIMAGDREDRKRILEFFDEFPSELIDKYNELNTMNLSEFQSCSVEIEVNDNEHYGFSIDSNDSFTFSKRISKGNVYSSVFELTLFNNIDKLMRPDSFEEVRIGYIYDRRRVDEHDLNSYERELYLIQSPYRCLLAYDRDGVLINKSFGKNINLDMVPNSLTMETLKNLDEIESYTLKPTFRKRK